uniref:FYVE-type domain-containing protein n=1 Tax=Hyaloperonospora arabidopsidis (strain Emoy2) TaxID=559515 RepID=M4BPB9_HYAAE
MKKKLVRVANETSNALIKDTLAQDEPGAVLWRPAQRLGGAPSGIHVLRGTARDVDKAREATRVRAVSDHVHASIEEFALLFKLDSSREAADHLLLFNADLVQHATLFTLVAPSGQQPRRYVGVKWALVASPSRFFRKRDFCYLECQKEFTDAKGRRGWVRSLHSLKLPCCPPLETKYGIVRASIYRSGLTAVETDEPGVLSVTYTVELDLKGRMALELLQPKFVAQRVAALATVDKLLQQQRLSSSPLLGDLDIPNKKRTQGSCNLCFRELALSGGLRDTLAAIANRSTKSKRYVCRKCGEGVCRRCSDDWWLDVPVVGRTKVRICTVCSAAAKQSHISAHGIHAGTCPIRGSENGVVTQVEGETHPNLLGLPLQHAKRHSVSLVERRDGAAPFFVQQEEMKRDLELRATELNRRVKIWDEMQEYERDSSLQPDLQQHVQKQLLQEQRKRTMKAREQKKDQLLRRVPSSSLFGHEEEKEEPEMEVVPQHHQTRSISKHESEESDQRQSFDQNPSSEDTSSQEFSDSEGEPVIRLTAEAGTQLSSHYRDSDLSDYEEHTINGLGEIRTTTDITRWWQDQQCTSEASEQEQLRPRADLSPVSSLRNDTRDVSDDDDGNEGKCKMRQVRQQPSRMASAEEQEMVHLFNDRKRESMNEIQHQRHKYDPQQRQQLEEFEELAQYQEEQARRRQQSDFEEMAQYQEEQVRRRHQTANPPVHRVESGKPCSPSSSALNQIQQQQEKLEHLRHNRQVGGDDLSVCEARKSNIQSSKEWYLQQQRQQHLDVDTEKRARVCGNQALDESIGDDVELMETSQGEWVPANHVRTSKSMSAVSSVVSPPRRGFGLCSFCGSPEYTCEKGSEKPSCECNATPTKTTGTVLFDGKWISTPGVS